MNVAWSTPAYDIVQANRERLGIIRMDEVVAFDQSQSPDDLLQPREGNRAGTVHGNGVVPSRGTFAKCVAKSSEDLGI